MDAKGTLQAQAAEGERAAQSDREREERIAACEQEFSDGFVSSWADGLTAEKGRLAKAILANDGKAWFWRAELIELATGEKVNAKVIRGQYGECWAFMGADGNFTGRFITAYPKRKVTIEKKGYIERIVLFEAEAVADLKGSGTGLAGATSVRAIVRPADREVEWTGRAGITRDDAEGWSEQTDMGLDWQERVFAD